LIQAALHLAVQALAIALPAFLACRLYDIFEKFVKSLENYER
jgi:hypothetical protein